MVRWSGECQVKCQVKFKISKFRLGKGHIRVREWSDGQVRLRLGSNLKKILSLTLVDVKLVRFFEALKTQLLSHRLLIEKI